MMNIRTLALLAMATTTLAVTELPAQEQHRSPTLEEYTLGSPKRSVVPHSALFAGSVATMCTSIARVS